MVKIGMVIADRYEVIEKIGTGGMSDVYKAKDHKLNRFVAVKVLKQEFSENANFVSKFRVEAQAAAGLMHPNIVNVYDVGQEDGIHYIVMELVEGITLKKYIEKKARLSIKEALSIAIQVAMGIEAAHNNHIIHRDIKPQNVMISKEGKVKVTDFGIAKAATSNTITSNVMGSVHYTSPEQARGGYSDEKSDIYSLGITLFEMLTGRVPFNGETTVAIAIKHIQQEMPSPRDFVSEIPVSVEQIVFKCCQKSPDRRYQSMSELIRDLKKALMNPDENFVQIDRQNELGTTKTMDEKDLSEVRKSVARRDTITESINLRTEEEARKESARSARMRKQREEYPDNPPADDPYYEDEYDDGPAGYDDRYEDSYEDDYDSRYGQGRDPKMEKLTTIFAVAAAVLIGLVVIFLVAKALGLFKPGSGSDKDDAIEETTFVKMIDVAGKDADKVKVALLEAGLTPEIEYEESADVALGKVIRCSLAAGEVVPEGTNVVLTVSMGANETGIEVPDVVSKSEAEAVAMLVDKGFVPSKTEGHDEFIAKGNIFKQSPEAGSKAPADSSVTIWISLGPEENKINVPDVTGQDEMTAMSILTEKGLALGNVIEEHYDDSAYKGKVFSQSPVGGSYADPGSKVDVRISIGPEQQTYRFTDTIQAPTPEEDPDYRSGTMVTVTLFSDDGTTLLSTQTSSFPLPEQSITGITSPTGVLLFQYTNTTEDVTVTNEDGTVETIEGGTETKEIRRPVTFTAG
ncbi:MAG: Stk1 family PASTA domain-containing Ser/Thr kinase [Lachnospiraceae bacterium]|nr:Stk1 family PASTA domain-containing Ser/Thr kinase [Lachnospiraceae bacterium]